MATTLNLSERVAVAGERFAQLARAGLPFNPLAHIEIAGANLKRLQDAMKMMEWTDPRFVDQDQAQALGWATKPDAMQVQTLVRDESSGEVKNVILYNAVDVEGMPPLEAFIKMSGNELSSLRSRAAGEVQQGENLVMPVADGADIDDEEFSIGPARSLVVNVPAALAPVESLAAAIPVAEANVSSAVPSSPQEPVKAEQRPATRAPANVKLEKVPAADRFAILAPYWRDGLHNTEGLALADEINKTIAARELAEDREAIARLLDVHEKAQRLGLAVVPEEMLRNDPSLLANPAQPRTLLGGALVRDNKGAYRPAAGGKPVLQDNGDTVSLKSKSAEGYQAAMELAIAKGWTAIELKGKPAMLADAWLEAKLKGLDVVNYSPTKKDIEKYAERVAEEKARAQAIAAPMESTPELVEVRPFVDAEGHAKTATVVYTISQTAAEPQPFESARDAAKAFAAMPASASPVVIRTVTHVDGNSRTDVVAAVGDVDAGAANGVEIVLDEEFELAMIEEIAESKAAALSMGPTAEGATRHIGEILGVDGDQVVQSIGRGKTVRHDISSFEGRLPEIGEIADIQHANGVGRVRDPGPDRGVSANVGR